MKIYKLLPIVIVLLVFTNSCERDDICPESTPTTPNLQLQFFDINNPEAPKTVNGLSIRAEGEDDYIVFNSDVAIASLPLIFGSEGIITTTRFELVRDTELDLDEDDNTSSNTDIIEFSYTPEFIYVSRACGFKSVFNSVQITIISDGDNWVLNSDINIPNIENEDEAHITIFH